MKSMSVLLGQRVKVVCFLSVTVMVWTQLVLELPQASVAVNWRRSEERRVGIEGGTGSLRELVTGELQSSLAVASAELVTLVEALQTSVVIPENKGKAGGHVAV